MSQLHDKCSYYLATRDLSVFTDEERATLKIFVQTDQSGAEALIVAYLCRNADFRKLFIHGVKPHVYVATHVFSEVWNKKMRELNADSDIKFDINSILSTPIENLKTTPFFKELDLLIKDSDNWPVNERYYYLAKQTCHCVDGETEVLTKGGWKRIDSVASLENLEDIMVVDKKLNSYFERPKYWNSIYITDNMYVFYGDEVNQFVTNKHTVIYESNGKLHSKFAEDAIYLKRPDIPTSVQIKNDSINHPHWYVKLLVAIQADGCIYNPEKSVRFRFNKCRKIDRLRSILDEAKLEYSIQHTDVCEIYVKNIQDILSFFGADKIWNNKLLSWSYRNMMTFVDELKYWDGSSSSSYNHKREEYITKHLVNAEWVKTICHLVNRQGTINKCGEVYKVGINKRRYSIPSTKIITEPWTGQVYCPTVSTGMFLIRRHGKISVTGNSANYGITANPFRMNILEKSGGKIVVSKEEADRFLLVYHSLFPEIREWHRRLREQCEKTHIVYNLHGHPLTITWYEIPEDKWKEIYALPPQSTVAMITNIAFSKLQIYTESEQLLWDHLINCHDSISSQCPIGEEVELAKKHKEYIEMHFESPVDGAKFQMRSETQFGFNLAPYKKGKDGKPDKNKLGLRELKF